MLLARRALRDRDAIYGDVFAQRVKGLGIREILIAPRAPRQNPFAERVIGSIRRECLDHIIVFNERHLRRLLRSYLVPIRAKYKSQRAGASSRSPRSADFITGISAQPECRRNQRLPAPPVKS